MNDIVDPRGGEVLDWTYKGIDRAICGLKAAEVGSLERSLFDDRLLMPVAVLKQSAVKVNSAWMREFLALTGTKIAPHGKTTMAPELFRIQMEDGAWGFTAATVHHVRAYREFGVDRILMANQLVGEGAIEWILEELEKHPGFDFYCLVDSVDNVETLEAAVRHSGLKRPLQVLIEVGASNGRAGVRTLEQGMLIATRVAQAHPFLELVGVETFEGVFQRAADGEQRALGQLELVMRIATDGDRRGLFRNRLILTAGGSGYFDLAAKALAAGDFSRTPELLLRSGCYLTHDDGMYAELYLQLLRRMPDLRSRPCDLRPALQVWGQVLSTPEPGRAICGVGRRDLGHETQLPVPVAWARPHDKEPRAMVPGCSVTALNDQHAYMECPTPMPFAVGDLVGFGISHPCTTFDKWRALLMVDDGYRIVSAVRTYF